VRATLGAGLGCVAQYIENTGHLTSVKGRQSGCEPGHGGATDERVKDKLTQMGRAMQEQGIGWLAASQRTSHMDWD